MGKFAILAQKAIFTEGVGSTGVLLQVGLEGSSIDSFAKPNFSSGRTNNAEL
jgi:hypothetical protein